MKKVQKTKAGFKYRSKGEDSKKEQDFKAKNDFDRIAGQRSCRAVFKLRPDDIIRFYVLEDIKHDFSDIMKWCAKHRKAYHLVNEEDLRKISQTKHHEGVCIFAKKATHKKITQNKDKGISTEPLGNGISNPIEEEALIFVLEGVDNPHNLGAIIRTASHFGLKKLYVIGKPLENISTAAYRTAQGGFEDVKLIFTQDLEAFLRSLKEKKFRIYGTSDHLANQSLFKTDFKKKSVIIFGSETHGISKKVQDMCDRILIIPHSGLVKSLNVSSAFAIMLAEVWRQNHG